jgi:hypothetical protein
MVSKIDYLPSSFSFYALCQAGQDFASISYGGWGLTMPTTAKKHGFLSLSLFQGRIPGNGQIYRLFANVPLQVFQQLLNGPPIVENSWSAAPGSRQQLLQLRMGQLVAEQLLPAEAQEQQAG